MGKEHGEKMEGDEDTKWIKYRRTEVRELL
jgi:hypothetical protein